MPVPSSENHLTPNSFICASGAIFRPACETVIGPHGYVFTIDSRLINSVYICIFSYVSGQGITLGIAKIEVKPPCAAALVPVRMVSFSSWPGWRRWTCTSTNPGRTVNPVPSISSYDPAISSAICRIAFSSNRTCTFCSLLWYSTSAFLMILFILFPQQSPYIQTLF